MRPQKILKKKKISSLKTKTKKKHSLSLDKLISCLNRIKSHREIVSFCKRKEFKFLGEGAFRTVYSITLSNGRKFALKIANSWAYDDNDSKCNSTEIKTWENALEKKLDKGLIKIVAYDKKGHKNSKANWILTEFVLKNSVEWSLLFKVKKNISLYRENKKYRLPAFCKAAVKSWVDLNIGDFHNDNFGIRKDKSIVILDYAGKYSYSDYGYCSCSECNPYH